MVLHRPVELAAFIGEVEFCSFQLRGWILALLEPSDSENVLTCATMAGSSCGAPGIESVGRNAKHPRLDRT
jgi:hypothetical protein